MDDCVQTGDCQYSLMFKKENHLSLMNIVDKFRVNTLYLADLTFFSPELVLSVFDFLFSLLLIATYIQLITHI